NTENVFYHDAKGKQLQEIDLYSDEEQEEVENLIDTTYKFFHKSKYLNHSEENITAGRVLALEIATYYFNERWGNMTQKKMLKIDQSFSDLTTVIKLIRRDLSAIDDRSHLIIFIQVDEFQLDPKLMVAMLRYLTEYIAEGNFTNESTVLIPFMTGTSPISIENMEVSNCSATMYSLRHHFLSPLGKKISCELVASSAHYHASIKGCNMMYIEVKENTNTLVSVLIDACGGIAICLIQLSTTVGTYEHRGIIFLKVDDDDELTACFLLIFINTIASIYKLRFLEILLNLLCRLDEDSFPDFIMAKHYSEYYLLRQAGYTTVQFREIYGNFVLRPKCPGKYSEFEKPQISDRKKIAVIAEGEKYKEMIIDSTSDEQYKYVAALSSRHQLSASAVCQINMEVVLNEIKKAIAVLCGNDLFSFIGVYGGLLRFIAKSPDELEYDETKDEKK
ncbi:486_t:CDS:2, partial [Funneliformis geosporum]